MYSDNSENVVSLILNIADNYCFNAEFCLDLGCGTGIITEKLSERFKMTGIDLSNEMLNVARKKNQTSSNK